MKKRILCFIEDQGHLNEEMLAFYQEAQTLGDAALTGLYVKQDYNFNTTINEFEYMMSTTIKDEIIKNYENFQIEHANKIEKKFKEKFKDAKFVVEHGNEAFHVLGHLKGHDLLIGYKDKAGMSPTLKEVLFYHYKPIITLIEPKQKLENILVGFDGSTLLNRSFSNFLHLLYNPKQKFTFLLTEKNLNNDINTDIFKEYLDFQKINYEFITPKGDPIVILKEESKNYDMVVLKALRHKMLTEKVLGGKMPLLLSGIKTPIFIG